MYRKLWVVAVLTGLAASAAAQRLPVDSTKALYHKISISKADTFKVKLLIHTAEYVINKFGSGKKQLDSSLSLLRQGEELSRQLKSLHWANDCLTAAGIHLINHGDTTAGYDRFRQVISSYNRSGDLMREADSWNTYGNFLQGISQNYQGGIQAYEKALKIFKAHHQDSLSVHTSVHISTTYYKMGKYDLAIPALIKDEKDSKRTGRILDQLDCDNALAEYFWRKGNIQQSLYYNLEALKIGEKRHNKRDLFFAHTRLGILYYNLKLYDQALDYLDKSYKYAWDTKDEINFHTCLLNVVHTKAILNKSDDLIALIRTGEKYYPPVTNIQQTAVFEAYGLAYDALGDNALAEKNFLKAMALFDEAQKKGLYGANLEIFIRTYNRAIGDSYLHAKKFEKARPYYQKVLRLPKNIITPNTELEVRSALFKIDSAAGNFIAAIRHYQVKTQLHDSLYNATALKQVAELNSRYEADQRLNDIKLLKSQRDSQQLFTQKAILQRNITISGIAGLLLVAGLAYAGYRNKEKLTLRLQAQQVKINQQNYSLQELVSEKEVLLTEKDWLLKEVHHRVKNNLQIIMSLLNSQSVYTDDPAALEAIKISRDRVQAISLIHQKLSNEINQATVNIKSYVAELVNYLSDGFDTLKKNILFRQSIEPVSIDIAQAVSIALILNEAITNSIKYAFDKSGGEIMLSLKLSEDNIIELMINDNGTGIDSIPDLQNITSLGFNIMKGLSAQLKGDFSINNHSGMNITIKFPLKKIKQLQAS